MDQSQTKLPSSSEPEEKNIVVSFFEQREAGKDELPADQKDLPEGLQVIAQHFVMMQPESSQKRNQTPTIIPVRKCIDSDSRLHLQSINKKDFFSAHQDIIVVSREDACESGLRDSRISASLSGIYERTSPKSPIKQSAVRGRNNNRDLEVTRSLDQIKDSKKNSSLEDQQEDKSSNQLSMTKSMIMALNYIDNHEDDSGSCNIPMQAYQSYRQNQNSQAVAAFNKQFQNKGSEICWRQVVPKCTFNQHQIQLPAGPLGTHSQKFPLPNVKKVTSLISRDAVPSTINTASIRQDECEKDTVDNVGAMNIKLVAMPPKVMIQKNMRAQQALMKNMQDSWRQQPNVRKQYISGSSTIFMNQDSAQNSQNNDTNTLTTKRIDDAASGNQSQPGFDYKQAMRQKMPPSKFKLSSHSSTNPANTQPNRTLLQHEKASQQQSTMVIKGIMKTVTNAPRTMHGIENDTQSEQNKSRGRFKSIKAKVQARGRYRPENNYHQQQFQLHPQRSLQVGLKNSREKHIVVPTTMTKDNTNLSLQQINSLPEMDFSGGDPQIRMDSKSKESHLGQTTTPRGAIQYYEKKIKGKLRKASLTNSTFHAPVTSQQKSENFERLRATINARPLAGVFQTVNYDQESASKNSMASKSLKEIKNFQKPIRRLRQYTLGSQSPSSMLKLRAQSDEPFISKFEDVISPKDQNHDLNIKSRNQITSKADTLNEQVIDKNLKAPNISNQCTQTSAGHYASTQFVKNTYKLGQLSVEQDRLSKNKVNLTVFQQAGDADYDTKNCVLTLQEQSRTEESQVDDFKYVIKDQEMSEDIKNISNLKVNIDGADVISKSSNNAVTQFQDASITEVDDHTTSTQFQPYVDAQIGVARLDNNQDQQLSQSRQAKSQNFVGKSHSYTNKYASTTVRQSDPCRRSFDIGFVDVNTGIVGRKLIGNVKQSATNNDGLSISRTQSHITDNSTLPPVLQKSDEADEYSMNGTKNYLESHKKKATKQSKSSQALVTNNSQSSQKPQQPNLPVSQQNDTKKADNDVHFIQKDVKRINRVKNYRLRQRQQPQQMHHFTTMDYKTNNDSQLTKNDQETITDEGDNQNERKYILVHTNSQNTKKMQQLANQTITRKRKQNKSSSKEVQGSKEKRDQASWPSRHNSLHSSGADTVNAERQDMVSFQEVNNCTQAQNQDLDQDQESLEQSQQASSKISAWKIEQGKPVNGDLLEQKIDNQKFQTLKNDDYSDSRESPVRNHETQTDDFFDIIQPNQYDFSYQPCAERYQIFQKSQENFYKSKPVNGHDTAKTSVQSTYRFANRMCPVSQTAHQDKSFATDHSRQKSELDTIRQSHGITIKQEDQNDSSRERQLFGKTISDLQAEEVKRLTVQASNWFGPQAVGKQNLISELRPLASMQSYKNALGMMRDTSSDQVLFSRRCKTGALFRDNSDDCNANRGDTNQSNLQKSVASQVTQKNSLRMTSNQVLKNPPNFLNTQSVDQNRINMERYKKALETQYNKQKANLERGMQSHVRGSVNKHLDRLRNGKGSFMRGSRDMKFEQKQLVAHRQGQMLEKLKQINNLANQESFQTNHLHSFINHEVNHFDKNRHHKISQASQFSTQHINPESSAIQLQPQSSISQFDSGTIQQFERRNKLLAGIHRHKSSNSPHHIEEKCQKVSDRIEQTSQAAAGIRCTYSSESVLRTMETPPTVFYELNSSQGDCKNFATILNQYGSGQKQSSKGAHLINDDDISSSQKKFSSNKKTYKQKPQSKQSASKKPQTKLVAIVPRHDARGLNMEAH